MASHREKLMNCLRSSRATRTYAAQWWVPGGLCLLLIFCSAGCTLGPDFVRPEAPKVEQYTIGPEPDLTISADGHAQHFKKGDEVASGWWLFFNSSKLNDVIKDAVSSNQTLQAAQASLRQSQNSLRAGYGVFYPQLDAGFDAERQRYSPAHIGSSAPSSIFNLYTLSATVSYTLDVFGGERRAVENLGAQVDFQTYTVFGTYLTLTGNVVNAIIARAAYREQIDATEELIRLLREQTEIAEAQYQAGTIPYLNVVSLRSQLYANEATIPPLRQRLTQTEDLLAILSGRTPAEWTPPEVGLADITLPDDLPISLPSKLVRQRPDILAAEAQLHSASANIGVATAALFPSFTLNGGYGLDSTSMKNLFNASNSVWSFGANLTTPLFHGGTLWFQRQAAIESYNQFLANYRQIVLGAFAQVADTLRALEHDAETLHAQSQALVAAADALQLVQENYQAGLVNYVQVMIADGQYHQAKIAYLQAIAQRLQDTVALFVALGGGWWHTDEKIL